MKRHLVPALCLYTIKVIDGCFTGNAPIVATGTNLILNYCNTTYTKLTHIEPVKRGCYRARIVASLTEKTTKREVVDLSLLKIMVDFGFLKAVG